MEFGMVHGMIFVMEVHEKNLAARMAWIGNALEKLHGSLVEMEAADGGCYAHGDAHAHAVALLAQCPPIGLDLLENGLEGSLGECSAFRPRKVGKAF